MGGLVNPPWLKGLAWITTAVIIGLNVYLLYATFTS
jgi:manganese transport protein